MTELFEQAHRAFCSYIDTFRDASGALSYPMQAKFLHTEEVCSIMDELIEHESVSCERDILIFKLCALFHDVSRFEQIARFHTFLDAVSFDHGNRSAELISEQKFLDTLDSELRSCVINAIRVHNKFAIPADFPEECLPAAKMIRDADKLAILNLIIRFFNGDDNDPTIRLDLPDSDGFTREILDTVSRGECVHYPDMRCVNDFKLGLFAWVNDLNYPSSFRYAHEKQLFVKLRNLMPESAQIDEILAKTCARISERMNS